MLIADLLIMQHQGIIPRHPSSDKRPIIQIISFKISAIIPLQQIEPQPLASYSTKIGYLRISRCRPVIHTICLISFTITFHVQVLILPKSKAFLRATLYVLQDPIDSLHMSYFGIVYKSTQLIHLIPCIRSCVAQIDKTLSQPSINLPVNNWIS